MSDLNPIPMERPFPMQSLIALGTGGFGGLGIGNGRQAGGGQDPQP
mgnify:CR=1 FL=1